MSRKPIKNIVMGYAKKSVVEEIEGERYCVLELVSGRWYAALKRADLQAMLDALDRQ